MLFRHGLAGLAHKAAASAASTDDFNRADEALNDNANWTRVVGAGSTDKFGIVSNVLRGGDSTTGGTGVQLHGDTRANDQYCQMRYNNVSGGADNTRIGPTVRCTAGATTMDGYAAFWQYNTTTTGDWYLRLFKWTDGDFGTFLGEYNFGDTAPSNTDILKLKAIGTTISVDHDTGGGFVERISVTDADHASGFAGVNTRVDTAAFWMEADDWEAGDI